ncbi:hypothetical protein DV701_13720 [Ornithinimicrobium avium]|uniref:Uncharacterized protein n=1 Tax=Ornithinimicrobium avium TaxID=2283195 RepID=A0A345NPT1_9MICO|nr:hypothetical protein DV701_13720 [Ornithinimicrobium avium]
MQQNPDSLSLPEDGSAPPRLLDLLKDHAPDTREVFLYAIWEGFDMWDAGFDAPKIGPYYIFESDGLTLGGWEGAPEGLESAQPANVIAPLDGTWLMATPIDSHETFVASMDSALTDAILADEWLDAVLARCHDSA